jgi:hypothetical protein
MSRIEWLTLATNRTPVKHGFEKGRSSWKLHAVRLEDQQQKFSDIPKGTGLSAAFGTRADSTSICSSKSAAKGANAFSQEFRLEPNYEPLDYQDFPTVRDVPQ